MRCFWCNRFLRRGLALVYAQGLVAVQDIGAQQAARLLDVQPGMRVLDACAAPGGAAHLLRRRQLTDRSGVGCGSLCRIGPRIDGIALSC